MIKMKNQKNKPPLDAIIVIDEKGIIQSCNQVISEMLGYQPDEVVGRNVSVLMPEPHHSQHDTYIQSYLKTGEKKLIDVGRFVEGKHKEGNLVELFLSVSPVFIGNKPFFTGVLREVKSSLLLTEQLALSEAKNEALLDNSLDGIVTINEKGIIQSCNSSIETVFGYQPEEVIGKNVSMLTPEPHRSEHDHYIERYLKTGKKQIIGIGREVRGVRKDGQEFDAYLTIAEIKSDQHHWFTGIVRDISDKKLMQEMLELLNRSPVPHSDQTTKDPLLSQTILMVTNDLTSCFSISKALKSVGSNVQVVDTAGCALSQLLEPTQRAFLLVDTELPDISGFDFIRQIKDHANWKDIPVIAMTEKLNKKIQKEGKEIGVETLFEKPVDNGLLLNTMRKIIDPTVALEEFTEKQRSELSESKPKKRAEEAN